MQGARFAPGPSASGDTGHHEPGHLGQQVAYRVVGQGVQRGAGAVRPCKRIGARRLDPAAPGQDRHRAVQIAVLLVASIVSSMRLSGRITKLKADEAALRQTIGDLVMASSTAERAIVGLRATLDECDRTLADRLGTAGRRHVKEKWTWEIMGKRLRAVLECDRG